VGQGLSRTHGQCHGPKSPCVLGPTAPLRPAWLSWVNSVLLCK
jgi:hypothetical protein